MPNPNRAHRKKHCSKSPPPQLLKVCYKLVPEAKTRKLFGKTIVSGWHQNTQQIVGSPRVLQAIPTRRRASDDLRRAKSRTLESLALVIRLPTSRKVGKGNSLLSCHQNGRWLAFVRKRLLVGHWFWRWRGFRYVFSRCKWFFCTIFLGFVGFASIFQYSCVDGNAV